MLITQLNKNASKVIVLKLDRKQVLYTGTRR